MNWIEWLNAYSKEWAEVMWRAVWQGSLAMLAVWALSNLTVKILPASGRAWLWRIAFLKLALALLWVTPIRLPLLPGEPNLRPAEVEFPIAASPAELKPSSAVLVGSESESAGKVDWAALAPASSGVPRFNSAGWLLLLWVAGVVFYALGIFQQWRQVNQLVQRARFLGSHPLTRLCETLAQEFGCKRAPKLMASAEIRCPVVIGIVEPVILLPDKWGESESCQHRRMMLAHELAHVKRRDLLWLWLPTVVRGFFFFHPLVWLASRESRLAQEVACDEWAVGCLEARPAEYAMMLVDVASGVPSPRATPLAVGVVESYRTLKRRLKAMKHIHAKSKKHLALAAVLTAVLGIGIVVPWQLTAQNASAAAPPIAATPVGEVPAPPALAPAEDEADAPLPPPKPAMPKRKRAAANNFTLPALPAAPPVVGRNETINEDGTELTIRGQALNVDVVPRMAPYATEIRSRIGPAQESNESRDQLLRYKLIFKSGLARLRHLLNQASPDESDVETALTLVGKMEHQLVALSEPAENRDLASTGKVIQEQLTELNAAVGAATSEKTPPMRAKRLTRAKAIVEGLTELVPDIDALGGKSNQSATVKPRSTSGYGSGYGSGGVFGGGASSGGSGGSGLSR